MKNVPLYLMAAIYALAGVCHFVNPLFYEAMMPAWLPYSSVFNYFGGVVEIILAVLLLPRTTRRVSAILIITMLIIFFFVIHIPMALHFYKTDHPGFWISIIRLPIQFVLIWWAWLYAKPYKA